MVCIMKNLHAVYKKSGKNYVGWVEEIPGANTQGRTLSEVKENLQEAVMLVLEANRLLARRSFASGRLIRESLVIGS